jgi:type II secretory pathway pseudopilin PulG
MFYSMRRRGVSLIETIFAMALVGLVLSLGILQFRAPVTGAGSKSVAQVLAAQLISARKRAMSQHTNVAVVVPAALGTRPYAQSIFLMDGDAAPHVRQVINLARDFPRSYVAVGTWDRAQAATVDAPVQRSAFGSEFNLTAWLNGATAGYQAKDYVIAFTPDGKVNTNDLPWVGGQLQLVACSGLDFRAAGGVPGTPDTGAHTAEKFELFNVYQPHTVVVSQEGSVSVVAGLIGANPPALSNTPVLASIPPAAAPVLNGPANEAPEMIGVEAFPQAEALVPGGYSAVIPATGFVTLVVRVKDEDAGDRLCCKFKATDASGGADAGTFSQGTGFVRMNWDPKDQGGCWKATWVWTPPGRPTDTRFAPPDGSEFRIEGEVVDAHGASTTFGGGANVISLQVVNRANVVFSADYQGRRQLFRMSPQTRTASVLPLQLETKADVFAPAVSPDGQQLLYIHGERGVVGGRFEVRLCDISGSNDQLIYSTTAGLLNLSWSPTATHFVFQEKGGPLRTMKVLAGATPTFLTNGSDPCWGDLPSRQWIAYADPTGDVQLIHPTSLATVQLTTDGATRHYSLCSWSNGSDVLFFQSQNGQIFQLPITWNGSGVPSTSATSPVAVGNGPGTLLSPLRFWGTPTQAVTSVATGLNIADYVNGASPTFVQNLGFQIDTPAYTSNWDDVNWIR